MINRNAEALPHLHSATLRSLTMSRGLTPVYNSPLIGKPAPRPAVTKPRRNRKVALSTKNGKVTKFLMLGATFNCSGPQSLRLIFPQSAKRCFLSTIKVITKVHKGRVGYLSKYKVRLNAQENFRSSEVRQRTKSSDRRRLAQMPVDPSIQPFFNAGLGFWGRWEFWDVLFCLFKWVYTTALVFQFS